MQSFIDKSKKIIENKLVNEGNEEFPYRDLFNLIKKRQMRVVNLDSNDLIIHKWFSLKILAPTRQYHYVEDPDYRFNPEIDHIFPSNPKTDIEYDYDEYKKWTDLIWNFQPIKGDINNLKLHSPPKDFFTSHPDYLDKYDHLPNKNINTDIWEFNNYSLFISKRKKNMLGFLRRYYGLNIKDEKDF